MHAAPVGLETRRDLGIMAPRQPPRRPWVAGKGVGGYALCHERTSHRPAGKNRVGRDGDSGAQKVPRERSRLKLRNGGNFLWGPLSASQSTFLGKGQCAQVQVLLACPGLFCFSLTTPGMRLRRAGLGMAWHGMMHLACLKHTSPMPG
jgi:hypothetical protein